MNIKEKMSFVYDTEKPHGISMPMWDGGYTCIFDGEEFETDDFEKGVDWLYEQALELCHSNMDKALALLKDVSAKWMDEQYAGYPKEWPSFDELTYNMPNLMPQRKFDTNFARLDEAKNILQGIPVSRPMELYFANFTRNYLSHTSLQDENYTLKDFVNSLKEWVSAQDSLRDERE